MLSKCLILWIGYFAASSNAGTVHFWLKQCPPLDSKCIVNSLDAGMTQLGNGVAELGTPPIEPLPIKDTEANVENLKIIFRNVELHQLTKCKFEMVTRDLDKSTMNITTVCPVGIKGIYKIIGNVLRIDVFGEGDFSIEGGTIQAKIYMNLKTVIKDGKKHYKLASFDYTFEPLKKYFIKFDNLYNGDKEKADPVVKLVNGAWKEMILNYGSPIMKECMKTIADVLDKVLQAISKDQLETA